MGDDENGLGLCIFGVGFLFFGSSRSRLRPPPAAATPATAIAGVGREVGTVSRLFRIAFRKGGELSGEDNKTGVELRLDDSARLLALAPPESGFFGAGVCLDAAAFTKTSASS